MFSSGAVITCFNDLGLSQLGFKQPTVRIRAERSKPLRHRRGLKSQECKTDKRVGIFSKLRLCVKKIQCK